MREHEGEYIVRHGAGGHTVVNRVSYDTMRVMTAEEIEDARAIAREQGMPCVVVEHAGEANPALARRAKAPKHCYTETLVGLEMREGSTCRITHKAWCDALNKRWNCNCDPRIVVQHANG